MDGLGDLLGGLGEIFGGFLGGDAAAEGAMGFAELFEGAGEGRRGNDAAQAIVYERYLCGGPRTRNINDR